MFFHFRAKHPSGKEIEESREAKDRYALANQLRKEGLTPIAIQEEKKKVAFNWASLLVRFSPVTLEEKVFFAGNLGSMLEAGLPLNRGLSVLGRQTTNPKLKNVIIYLGEKVEKGSSLSDALKQFPEVFSAVFVAMVNVGENSGKLPQSLKSLSSQLEKTYELKKKVRGAMIYPLIIVSAMMIIGVLMLIYIVPTLEQTFSELKITLPFSTRLIIFFSNALLHYWYVFLLATGAFLFAVRQFFRTSPGRRIKNIFFLRAPVIGSLVKESNTALSTRTLASLVSSGVDIVGALRITADVIQNDAYRGAFKEAEEKIQKGASLSKTFAGYPHLFPVLVEEMVSVGEETGKLPEMLSKTAQFYEDRVDASTKNLSTIVEPLLMIIVGAAVGFFAVSMIQPIYNIGGAIK